MADKYRRPLNVFFLPNPPTESGEPAVPDFRTGENHQHEHSRYLRFALRTANEWRLDTLDLYKELQEEPIKFGLRVSREEGADHAADVIRSWLQISVGDQLAWPNDSYRALREWRDATERNGILVFQFGRVEVHEMRGSSLFFEELPVVILNAGDSPNGRIFTLMHELAHLALRGSSLCDVRYVEPLPGALDNVEIFCNAVAGALLVPRNALLAEPDVAAANSQSEWSDVRVAELAGRFKVSRLVILRRLLSLGKTNEAAYSARHYLWSVAGPDREAGGGDGRRMALNSRGQLFTKLVLAAYSSKKITLFDTARRLGIKADSIEFARDFIRS